MRPPSAPHWPSRTAHANSIGCGFTMSAKRGAWNQNALKSRSAPIRRLSGDKHDTSKERGKRREREGRRTQQASILRVPATTSRREKLTSASNDCIEIVIAVSSRHRPCTDLYRVLPRASSYVPVMSIVTTRQNTELSPQITESGGQTDDYGLFSS